jgi:hypothetical protein
MGERRTPNLGFSSGIARDQSATAHRERSSLFGRIFQDSSMARQNKTCS